MQINADNWNVLLFALLSAFGGWAVVVAALTYFLGELTAKRTLQREAAAISQQLAVVGHELSLQKSSYDRHFELLLNYYQQFYRHYRACQRAAGADAMKQPDGSITNTKAEFFTELDEYLAEAASQEGKIRLILPESILTLHDETLVAFNALKDVMTMKDYDSHYHENKVAKFEALHLAKQRIETALKDFLRTEHLIKR